MVTFFSSSKPFKILDIITFHNTCFKSLVTHKRKYLDADLRLTIFHNGSREFRLCVTRPYPMWQLTSLFMHKNDAILALAFSYFNLTAIETQHAVN